MPTTDPLNIPNWKLYAEVVSGKYRIRISDAFAHVPLGDVKLFHRKQMVVNIEVNYWSESGNQYLLTLEDGSGVVLAADRTLSLRNADGSEIVMTLNSQNGYIFEVLGLYEGQRVSYDDEREVGDGTTVPPDTSGLLVLIEPSGGCVVHWIGFGTEWGVDPSGLAYETFDPPPVRITTEEEEALEVLKAACTILLDGLTFNSDGVFVRTASAAIRIATADQVEVLRKAQRIVFPPVSR